MTKGMTTFLRKDRCESENWKAMNIAHFRKFLAAEPGRNRTLLFRWKITAINDNLDPKGESAD